ncbi:SUMF1/EgtB/PvdO family nonheme iron enzyme [Leptothoe sp. PORK10 BA2]|uniref:SUMF1/EgtB/PvdO family nonheme iron enzyme n=1 Tax=Leptothoe sp. PORK10 BA2 TaxID=3110254 RepID=UPI002B20D8E7|nr:SUMF1/EgtB/PvdO family nonheme iron enzyme [Leptothoe sp. PORK10 BA2]MEA5466662.1 SUMF1/EgtB/PvdO family nonheme iron enzyme [Leptothoe sp. PORK10 BA2]
MSKNWAICIGINAYYNLKPLNYAVQDAVSMRDFFLEEVNFEQVFYFSDNSPAIETPKGALRSLPTYANLKRFFRERFQTSFLNVGDNFWFFFAGHGELHEGHDYLMPIDVDPGNVEETALRISDITAALRNSGADNTMLLLDACRSQGRRGSVGLGTDEQPGIVTIYACSPRESSYEIEDLEHGVFTHVLLEGFRLQGANSRATVQRLDQYLRYEVPRLSQRHGKPIQTPYTAVEPLSKNCLILLPQRARLEDVEALKNAAFRAETKNEFDFAQQLWVRVLAASMVDQDAIEALQRIALNRAQQSSTAAPSSPTTAGSRSIADSVAKPPSQVPPPVPPKNRVERLEQPKVPDGPPPKKASTFDFEVVRVDGQGNITHREQKKAEYRRADLGQGVSLDLVMIPGGTFQMGSPTGQGNADERPQHSVTVSSFLMGKYPVTQTQWKAVAALSKIDRDLDPDLANFKGDDRPVEQVVWDDAVEFCKRLSKKTGRDYRLPSEAEWEYACRAGTTTAFYFGDKLTPKIAQCKSNFGMALVTMFSGQTSLVGSFPPNAFGLYDMHGNVWEWCLDHWHENYDGAPTDGSAWLSDDDNTKRLLRGGSWYYTPDFCRSASRLRHARGDGLNGVGFRVVCVSSWTL